MVVVGVGVGYGGSSRQVMVIGDGTTCSSTVTHKQSSLHCILSMGKLQLSAVEGSGLLLMVGRVKGVHMSLCHRLEMAQDANRTLTHKQSELH